MLAYGIGGLTPAEFGDLTPADFMPYINARIKREEEQIKMENERIGLICSILQNGIPTIMVKKPGKARKPSDYFGKPSSVKEAKMEGPLIRKTRLERIYDTMGAWVSATTKGGK